MHAGVYIYVQGHKNQEQIRSGAALDKKGGKFEIWDFLGRCMKIKGKFVAALRGREAGYQVDAFGSHKVPRLAYVVSVDMFMYTTIRVFVCVCVRVCVCVCVCVCGFIHTYI